MNTRWEVQHYTLCDGWTNVSTDEDGEPVVRVRPGIHQGRDEAIHAPSVVVLDQDQNAHRETRRSMRRRAPM